jgi:hypothetical protein
MAWRATRPTALAAKLGIRNFQMNLHYCMLKKKIPDAGYTTLGSL